MKQLSSAQVREPKRSGCGEQGNLPSVLCETERALLGTWTAGPHVGETFDANTTGEQ